MASTRNLLKDVPGPAARRHKKRPWPVTALSLLLLLQAAGLLVIGTLKLTWENGGSNILAGSLKIGPQKDLLLAAVFVPLAVLSILAAFSFLRLWRSAWLNAMLLQGVCLLVALIYYFDGKPVFAYTVMAFAVFMVGYLNYAGVTEALRPVTTDGKEVEGTNGGRG